MRYFRGARGFVAVSVLPCIITIGSGVSANPQIANPTSNIRPQIQFTLAPEPFDSVFYYVAFQWTSSDPDGSVDHHLYAIDPPAIGDTSWVVTLETGVTHIFDCATPPSPLPATGPVTSTGFHAFVIKAVDNEDLASPPVSRAFTTFTVAPQTQITSPVPSRLIEAITDTTVEIRWEGNDADGVATQEPILYKVRLASKPEIQQALGLGGASPSRLDLQDFFSEESPTFAGWDSVSPDSSKMQLTNLTSGTSYYFAVVTIDEAAAYEPRFLLDSNLLQFRASAFVQVEPTTWGRVKAERR